MNVLIEDASFFNSMGSDNIESTETTPTPAAVEPVLSKRSFMPIVWLLAACATLVSIAAATLEGIVRIVTCLGIAGATVMLALTVSVSSLPTEKLLPCREEGFISSIGGLRCTVDSGATSTAIPLSRQLKEGLLSMITVPNTKGLKIWIL